MALFSGRPRNSTIGLFTTNGIMDDHIIVRLDSVVIPYHTSLMEFTAEYILFIATAAAEIQPTAESTQARHLNFLLFMFLKKQKYKVNRIPAVKDSTAVREYVINTPVARVASIKTHSSFSQPFQWEKAR